MRRHPHVFGSDEERATGKVDGSWEQIKEQERSADPTIVRLPGLPGLCQPSNGRKSWANGRDASALTGRTARASTRRFTRSWGSSKTPWAPAKPHMEDELGDVLFAVVNLARHLDIDPEKALTGANYKFERRFRAMEAEIAAAGLKMSKMSLEALDQRWRKAKKDVG